MAELPALHEDWQSRLGPCDSFWHMFKHQVRCDVSFLVGKDSEMVGAHSMVLMARSSVFFNKFIAEIQHEEIAVEEVEPKEFKLFLKFLYTGETDIDNDNENILKSLAKTYNVEPLLRKLLTYQLSHMNAEEFCEFVGKNERQIRDNTKLECLSYVFDHQMEVFTSRTFSMLPRKFLKEVMTHGCLLLEENYICTAVLEWATGACRQAGLKTSSENQRQVLGDILYDIRFPLLSEDFFCDTVCEKGLLSSAEEVMVFMFFKQGERAVGPNFKFQYTQRMDTGEGFCDGEGDNLSNDCTTRPNVIESADCYLPSNQLNIRQPFAQSFFPSSGMSSVGSSKPGSGDSPSSSTVAVNSSSSQNLPLPPIPAGAEYLEHPATGDEQATTESKVERFLQQASGWCHSGKTDAICFSSSKDIYLESVMVYGSCDDTKPISLKFQFMSDARTCIHQFDKELQVDPAQAIYTVKVEMEGKPNSLALTANKEYHILVTVKGSPGYYGKEGQREVTADGVDFLFKKSVHSANNTNEKRGQIPGFIFIVR